MPGRSGEPVVTNSYVLFLSHTRLRVHQAPGFPAPSLWRVRNFLANLGRMARRECGCTSLRAKRSNPFLRSKERMDCFVARLLAMTIFKSSSPGLTGRSSIPETPAIEPRSRGVLDTPHARGMTSCFGAARQHCIVVPAKAGTHNPGRSSCVALAQQGRWHRPYY